MRAQALLANGKNDEAIRVLTDLRAATPGDSDTAASLIDAWIATQRFAEALAECDRVIAATGESIGMLQRKAVAEANLKRYREAKATLEKAHEKEPANADINRLLEQVAGLLGHGGK